MTLSLRLVVVIICICSIPTAALSRSIQKVKFADNIRKVIASVSLASAAVISCSSTPVHAASSHATSPTIITLSASTNQGSGQSKAWEVMRQKRTAAVKAMQEKGIIIVNTDDSGNQFLSLPWIPDQKIPYKQLSIQQRLVNEVCAGAFGEIAKDVILHGVDTMKTRRQAAKNEGDEKESVNEDTDLSVTPLSLNDRLQQLKGLYAGFPVVASTSIPQGGVFFFVKKGLVEVFSVNAPNLPQFISATVPIIAGVVVYWLFRTPAEVIKTQVQTGQVPSVKAAIDDARLRSPAGIAGLWRRYPVMLSVDIPFQIINFVLYGIVSDSITKAGFASNILSRLFCGISCGMVSAAVTCPLDMCKTRIIAKGKVAQKLYAAATADLIDPTIVSDADLLNMVQSDMALGASDRQSKAHSDLDDEETLVDGVEVRGTNFFKERNESSGQEIYKTLGSKAEVYEQVIDASANEETSFKLELREILPSNASIVVVNEEESGDVNPVLITSSVVSEESASGPLIIKLDRPKMRVRPDPAEVQMNTNVLVELITIFKEEGPQALFRGFGQRLLYTGLANGIRLTAYGTSRMDLMMRSLDDL